MKTALNKGWVYKNTITERDAGTRLLRFYVEKYPHSSGAEWLEKFDDGQIFRNGRPAQPDAPLQKGDALEYRRPPWPEPAVPDQIKILYLDESVAAVEKPSGLPVMPAVNFLNHTLLRILREKLGENVTPVHRLGRGTSGIVLFARTKAAEKFLFNEMRLRKIEKIYRALAVGIPDRRTFNISTKIGGIQFPAIGDIYAASEKGLPSESKCEVLFGDLKHKISIIQVNLITGRPHQIRIHLASVGHPLVGDPLYISGGIPKVNPGAGNLVLPGDCGYSLHAGRISFNHPEKRERVTIASDYPAVLTGQNFKKNKF